MVAIHVVNVKNVYLCCLWYEKESLLWSLFFVRDTLQKHDCMHNFICFPLHVSPLCFSMRCSHKPDTFLLRGNKFFPLVSPARLVSNDWPHLFVHNAYTQFICIDTKWFYWGKVDFWQSKLHVIRFWTLISWWCVAATLRVIVVFTNLSLLLCFRAFESWNRF